MSLLGSIIETSGNLLANKSNQRFQAFVNQQNHQHDFDIMREQQAMNLSGLASKREYGSPLEQKKKINARWC